MTSKSLTFMLLFIMSTATHSALASHHHFKINLPVTSTISASPSYFFPGSGASPLSSPAPSSSSSVAPPSMSPDITPLLPSPGPDSALSPSGLPTIPSSPSPPNPESTFAPEPLLANSPAGSMSDSSALDLKLGGFAYLGLLALWLLQI